MSDPSTLAPRISALLAERWHLQVPSPDTDLLDTGLVDSRTFAEFLAQLELEFGIQLSFEDLDLDRFRTVARIAQFVVSKRNGATDSPRAPTVP